MQRRRRWRGTSPAPTQAGDVNPPITPTQAEAMLDQSPQLRQSCAEVDPGPTATLDKGLLDHTPQLRRSCTEVIDLKTAEWWLSQGWILDTSKTRGHLVVRGSPSIFSTSLQAALDPSTNEFWNILTDFLPMIFFIVTAITTSTAPDGVLQQAVVADAWATAVQHACSMVAHAACHASARLSQAIWYVDYAGIVLNMMWNAPPLAFSLRAGYEEWWPLWCCLNLTVSVVLLGGAVRLAMTKSTATGTQTFAEVMTGGPLACTILSMTIPDLILSVGTPLIGGSAAADRLLPLWAICILIAGLTVKQLNIPERFTTTSRGRMAGAFDYSPAHSHSLWHVAVFFCQYSYLCYYRQAMSGASPAPEGQLLKF